MNYVSVWYNSGERETERNREKQRETERNRETKREET